MEWELQSAWAFCMYKLDLAPSMLGGHSGPTWPWSIFLIPYNGKEDFQKPMAGYILKITSMLVAGD